MKIKITASEVQVGDKLLDKTVLIADHSGVAISIFHFGGENKPFPLNKTAEVLVEREINQIQLEASSTGRDE